MLLQTDFWWIALTWLFRVDRSSKLCWHELHRIDSVMIFASMRKWRWSEFKFKASVGLNDDCLLEGLTDVFGVWRLPFWGSNRQIIRIAAKTGGRGRPSRGGRGSRMGGSGRRLPKTTEDLDQEMVDYYESTWVCFRSCRRGWGLRGMERQGCYRM